MFRSPSGFSVYFQVLLLLISGDAAGCAAGWESTLSLLFRARTVIEVEVLSVNDAPEEKSETGRRSLEERWSNRGEPRERKDALARVRVTGKLRGECPVEEFNLLGGPYYSCAPFACYWRFQKGGRYVLILDQAIPGGMETLRIRWRSRVVPNSAEEVGGLMKRSEELWKARISRVHAHDPDAFAAAKKLHQAGPGKWGDLLVVPYPVLAVLASLESDPSHLWGGARAAPGAAEVETSLRGDTPLPDDLAIALEESARSPSAADWNRGLFRRYVLNDLRVPEELLDRIMSRKDFAADFDDVRLTPELCRIWSPRSDAADTSLKSLEYLVAMAEEGGDMAAWVLHMVSDDLKLDPDVLLPWIRVNRDSNDFGGWGTLRLLFALKSKETAGLVRKQLEIERNSSRLDSYLGYFLNVDDKETAMRVMERIGKEEIALPERELDADEKTQVLEMIEYGLDQIAEILKQQAEPLPEFEEKLAVFREKAQRL